METLSTIDHRCLSGTQLNRRNVLQVDLLLTAGWLLLGAAPAVHAAQPSPGSYDSGTRVRRNAMKTLTALAMTACVASAAMAAPAPVAEDIRLQQIVLADPNDNRPAFTMLLPAGWRAACQIVYRMDRPASPADFAIRAISPDGQEEFNLLPETWAIWSPYLAQVWRQPRYLGNDLRQCPNRVADFLVQVVWPKFRPEVREARVVEAQDCPQLAEELTRMAPQPDNGRLVAQVARVRLEYRDPRTGQVMEEDLAGTLWISVTSNMDFLGGQVQTRTWVAERVFACRASKGALGRHADLLTCMSSSVRPDGEWMQRFRRAMAILLQGQADASAAAMRRSEIIAQSGRDTARIIHEAYQFRQATLDRTNAKFAQAIRGTATYQTPYETYPVELPGGYDYVWTSGQGQYILSNNPNFDPNQGSNVTWTQVHRTR